jgi:hypothetical protein
MFVFERYVSLVAVKMFSHLICIIKTFYKSTFRAACKDNAAINFITVQQRMGLIPVNTATTTIPTNKI